MNAANAANWIALYAAIVGTAALAWQSVTYLLERRPSIKIDLRLLYIDATKGEGRKHSSLADLPWRLLIDVVNNGKNKVQIHEMSIRTERNGNDVKWLVKRWNVPWILESGDSKSISLTSKDVGPLRQGQPLTGVAVTSTGRQFRSAQYLHGDSGSPAAVLVQPEHADEMLAAIKEYKLPKINEINMIGFSGELDFFDLGDDD
jgi:hypothetical protein